jgi:Holliday junction resolvase RusA-like endonuclease
LGQGEVGAVSKYVLEFELAGLPKMPNQLLGSHWRTRSSHASKWKIRVFAEVYGKRPEAPLSKAKVILTRLSSVEPDHDGLQGSFKPILDGLVKAGVLEDDKPSVIGRPETIWEKAKPKQGKIRVRVEEV